MYCSLLFSVSTWPEDGNSIVCPVSNFPLVLGTKQDFTVAFGNKTRALWVMSLKSASRRVCSIFSLVAPMWKDCIWFLILSWSEQFSSSVLSDGGSAQIWVWASCTACRFPDTWWCIQKSFFQRSLSFWRFLVKPPHLLGKKMITFPTWLTKCINKSLVLYWLKINLA